MLCTLHALFFKIIVHVTVMNLFSLTIDDHGERSYSSVEDRRILVHSSDSSLAAQVSATCTLHAV